MKREIGSSLNRLDADDHSSRPLIEDPPAASASGTRSWAHGRAKKQRIMPGHHGRDLRTVFWKDAEDIGHRERFHSRYSNAGVAQLEERRVRNSEAAGAGPAAGSIPGTRLTVGRNGLLIRRPKKALAGSTPAPGAKLLLSGTPW